MKKIEAYRVTLRAIQEDDLELLRNWRNQPEIRLNMINQDEISTEQQQKWFAGLQDTNQEHYLVEYKSQPVGYANYKPGRAGVSGQTGLYVGEKKYRGTVLAFCLALALLDYIFIQLNIKNIEADVFTHNKAAIQFNEQLGYVFQHEEGGLIKMTLKIDDYLKAKSNLTKLIRV